MTAADPEPKPPVPCRPAGFSRSTRASRGCGCWTATGKFIRAQAPYHSRKAGTWNHLTFTYDGSRTEDGYAFYLNGIRMPTERGSYGAQDSTIAPELQEIVVDHRPGTSGPTRRAKRASMARVADFRIFNRAISEEEARRRGVAGDYSPRLRRALHRRGPRTALKPYFLIYHDAGIPEAACGVRARQQRASRHRLRSNTAMVMEERPTRMRPRTLLFRGHVRPAARAR